MKIPPLKIRIFIVLTVIALIAVYFFIRESNSLTGHYASGIMEREQINLRAKASERVTQVFVEEGEFVEAGTVLLQLDSHRANLNLQAAKAVRDEVEANLLKLRRGPLNDEIVEMKAQLAAANAALEERKKTLDRVNSLAESSFSSESEKDRAKSLWLQALGKKDEMEARLRIVEEGTRKEDITSAEAALKAAEIKLELAELSLDDLTVRAPRGGWIENIGFVTGSTPALGETLVILLDGKAPYARIYIPEEWHTFLRENMKVSIEIDGRKDDVPGIIKFISADPIFTPYFALNQADRGHLSYPIKVQIIQKDAMSMPHGTPVRILLNQIKDES